MMHESLFILLRLGLEITSVDEENLVCFGTFTSNDWNGLKRLAGKHGVQAFALDGILKLPNSIMPEKKFMLNWIGQTLFLEKRNLKQIDVMRTLCNFWNDKGCPTMLMKGQANGLYYPNPLHRSTGDIDVYQFQHFQMGNDLAEQYCASVDTSWYKHSQIFFKGEMFENHHYFVHTRDGKRGKLLNKTLVELAKEKDNKLFSDSNIILPPVMFNALFLTYHGMAHFISEGIHLKQVLDWCMFLKIEQYNIDWKKLYHLCDQFHLHRFLTIMNDLAVNTFKVDVTNSEIETNSPYTEKVLNSILYDDDFVFGSGEGSWLNRLHLITNLFKYSWKYHEIYQESILKQIYYYVCGYLFKTEK